VAKAGWNLDQLQARAQDSIEKPADWTVRHSTSCAACCAMWTSYKDSATLMLSASNRLRASPHYLAISVLFRTVVEQLGKSGYAQNLGDRGKPFGTDLSAGI
jgi:glucose-6-phosphate 1-dehydrogenase